MSKERTAKPPRCPLSAEEYAHECMLVALGLGREARFQASGDECPVEYAYLGVASAIRIAYVRYCNKSCPAL